MGNNACKCCTSPSAVMSPSHQGSPQPPIISSSPSSIPNTSTPPPSIDAFMLTIQQVNPTDQIDPLINFIEDRLRRIKATPESASTSSSLLNPVASSTSLAATILDTISTEAEKLGSTDIAKEMGNIALSGLKKVGEAHWIFLGLSVAAYALERGVRMRSNASDCIDLLQAIVFLAKDLKRFKDAMPGESERLCEAVQIIVEGAIMCADYISKRGLSRYWSAETASAQLEKTNKSLHEIRSSLGFAMQGELLRKSTMRLEESPLNLLDFQPVGIEKVVTEVKALLDMEGTELALAVVLCGFGGVGKSTVAASVIQSLNWTQLRTSADFKFCRVIINDKSADETSHIMKLQQDIISDFGGGKQDLRNLHEGHRRLQEVMENKTCLLFIDNVVNKKYIQQLLPKDLLWFNKSIMSEKMMSPENLEKKNTKLRIFVTSREKNLKQEFNITCKEYDVHTFSNEQARNLLRQTILQSDGQFSGEFDENAFVNAVADACRGVPILLSVFGKHLREDRKPEGYDKALKALLQGNLDSFADQDLSEQLFFVYNNLRDIEDKEAFLDICKYFYGWQWNLVCNILDKDRLETLQKKMLIKSESGVLIVHDILRLMGEREAKPTRFSNYRELSQVLEDDEANLKSIKGISLAGNESSITLETKHLNATCHSLRVLMIGDWVKFEGPPCNKAFQNLRYLSVGDAIEFPFKDPSRQHKLRVFYNRSKDGMNLHQLPRSLRVISQQVADLDCHSFETLPLQSLPSLQSFIVETKKLVNLPEEFQLPASLVDLQLNCCRQLPKEFTNLTALEHLILDKCDMEFLPGGFGKLKKLKHLSMEYCTKLTSLPDELGLLSSMSCLRLRGCTLLQNLPDDLGKLSALEELSLRDCENLRELPQGFGGLSSLKKLDLTGCISLKRLPESFEELWIESLTLELLLSLDELPKSIGNMPCLSHLKLISCNSLTTLPNSFVQLKCLETLEISDCSNIVALPGDFGQLSFLREMTVKNCPELEELPHGFEALPALKTFQLINCSSLVNLPSGFGELICLETLWLKGLLFSSLPDGFGKLKRLDYLRIKFCYKLETLPDDFETLASLTGADLENCPRLDGAAMERIIKLQHCYYVRIGKSVKLIERWEEMREEDESPMAVCTEVNLLDNEEQGRAARVILLGGKWVELDSTTQQLIERSTSMLFEEDTTVAVIILPLHVEFHHQQLIQRLVGAAMEKAKTASTGRLRIVYVKRVKQKGETTDKEKEEEEDCFRQILKSMPKGSCAIPSTDMRRHRLFTYLFFDCDGYKADNKLACRMVNVGVDGKFVRFKDLFGEDDISGEALQSSESVYKENKVSNSVGTYIESICSGKLSETAGQSRSPPKESRFTEFLQLLKENNADHLIDSKLSPVQLDQLTGNVVGIFICDLNTVEYIKLQQIYKELKFKGHNFEVIWIPLFKNEFYGLGTYTRAIQKMTWTVLLNPNMVKLDFKNPHFIIFDQEGGISNEDALPLMMSWGVEAFPFTQSKINEIVSTMHIQTSLKLLFNKINLVNKEAIENKLTFLYAEPPSPKLKMKFYLEKLTQLRGNVEIIYVGNLFVEEGDITRFKEVYEYVIQKMHWSKLTFEDMVTFWYRCKYFTKEVGEKLNLGMEGTLKRLVNHLYMEKRWLVLLDNDGLVTGCGNEVLEKTFKPSDVNIDEVDNIMKKELMKSLQDGKCNKMVRTFFEDEIAWHPQHPQHPLLLQDNQLPASYSGNSYLCDICGLPKIITWDQQRFYRCKQCEWDMCINCWELFAKEKVKYLTLLED